jgi:CheY-like chemotaxis protein
LSALASAVKRSPILFAEDSADDVFFMQLALETAALPYPLCVVRDGQGVIDYLNGDQPYTDRRLHPLPALLLMDIKMPRLDGFAVLAWLQTRPDLDHIPVLVFTGSDLQSDRDKACALGADEYHVKPGSPLHPEKLIQSLRELLFDHRLDRPLPLVTKIPPHPTSRFHRNKVPA